MHKYGRWGLVLVVACGAWLCWQLFAREHTTREGREPIAVAQRETRLQLGLTSIATHERARLSGRVHDRGVGITGALICASCVACEATSAPSAPCTRSDEGGRYAFSELAAGGYFIAASADGYGPGSAHGGEPVYLAEGRASSGVDIALARGGARVRGSVVDATGGPIGHARVRALRLQPPRLSLDTVADAQGQFELWVQPGFIALSAEAEGYARASQRATAPTEVELRLVPGGSIEGVVVNARTQQPVAAIDVRAAPPENPQLAMARGAISDGDGRFRIEGLEPGAYLLTARGERLLGTPAQSIELGVAEQRSGVVIAVADAAEVSGRVLIAGADAPCQQGLVSLGMQSPLQPAPSPEELAHFGNTLEAIASAVGPEQVADIRSDGSVHFPGVPPGFYFVNVQCFSHLLEAGPRLLRVMDQPIADLDWRVARGGELTVRVLDQRGAALPEVEVVLEHPTTTSHVVSSLETDADGRCHIDGLAPGRYRVRAGREPEAAVSVEISAQRAAEATLRLADSGMILVEIADERGHPLDALSVHGTQRASTPPELARDSLRSSALPLGAGRYRLGPLPAGSYAITADDGVNPPLPPDSTPGAIASVESGRTTQTRIVLARNGVITGTVVDAHQGPLPDVWVSAKPQLNSRDPGSLHTFALAEARPQRVLTDSEGRFEIGNLAPATRFDVRALAPYGSAVMQRGVATGTELVLELPEPASISGVALDDAGQPVAQLKVTAISRGADSKQTRMFFDPAGRFALPRVAPGTVELSFFAADGRSASSSLQLAAGQRLTELKVTLQPSAELAAERPQPAP